MDSTDISNFSVTTTKSKKGGKQSLIIGAIAVFLLAVSVAAGVYLVRQQQDIKEKAAAALVCPAAEACPVAGEPALLRSCYNAQSGEEPQEISCSTIANVGTTTYCGASKYCCPSLGASWTTDLTLCATPSPTPVVTEEPASATTSASATATATPTDSSEFIYDTKTATPSAAPIPVTGTSWPTFAGIGVGVVVIIGSILLVL